MPNRTAEHSLTLNVEEAAALIGVSRSTAYDLVTTDELPTVRLRRRILVPAASLADLLGVSLVEVYAALGRLRGRSEPPATATPCADPPETARTGLDRARQSQGDPQPDGTQQLW